MIGATVNTQSTSVGGEIVEVTDGGPAERAASRVATGDQVGDRAADSGEGLIAAIRPTASVTR